jgi:acetyl-CoA carboxylase biotin carboxylase subunit
MKRTMAGRRKARPATRKTKPQARGRAAGGGAAAAAPRPARGRAAGSARVIRRVLIANRGEIALRVLRACREAGLSPAVVYSEADRDSLPVRLADAAWPIGPAPATQSYLRIETILEAARRTGADAVHPGYGFLAENADFAQACADAGLTFIGPSPRALKLMGDKVEARRLAAGAGVPVIPGLTARAADLETIRVFGRKAGWPILLKAAAGGGGKGMRVVRREADLEGALRAARSEARASFGDDGVYAEKFLESVRHIEVQVLADTHGDALHLNERECSLQRRHQKLIEESPSVAIDDAARDRIGRLALQVVRAGGYHNAGTVEFLVDGDGRAWFMEVNARIQVEHPVTEMVTGIDLVRSQIEIAAGGRLPARQDRVRPRGWAIECRILAEDPGRGFQPSPGRIAALRIPAGPGIRVDTALRVGDEVSLHYDALVAKLIAWGRDRAECVARMRRAIDEMLVAGIRTTLPFHREVLRRPEFLAGVFDIAWVDRNAASLAAALGAAGPDEDAAIIASAIVAVEEREGRAATPRAGLSPWTLLGRRALMETRQLRPPRG